MGLVRWMPKSWLKTGLDKAIAAKLLRLLPDLASEDAYRQRYALKECRMIQQARREMERDFQLPTATET